MIEIFHNNRCSKSRCALEILANSEKEYVVRDYQKQPPNKKEISQLLKKLDIPAIELVRKNEKAWQSYREHPDLSEEDIIEALVTHPVLIERPIVVFADKAIIARPPEILNNYIQGPAG